MTRLDVLTKTALLNKTTINRNIQEKHTSYKNLSKKDFIDILSDA